MSLITHSIADTLDARADEGDPLSPAEMRGIAATLRSAPVRREAMGLYVVPTTDVKTITVHKIVPGRAVWSGDDDAA